MCAKGWNFNVVIVSGERIEFIDVKHPLYRLRYGMLSRCYNARDSEFNVYQGKGIEVCSEWKFNPSSFYQWALDNGWERGLSIDRIDSDSHYQPNNCQFITISENSKKTHEKHSVRGEKAPNAILNEVQVREIRDFLSQGISWRKIAQKYNVSSSTIGGIKSGKLWKHLK